MASNRDEVDRVLEVYARLRDVSKTARELWKSKYKVERSLEAARQAGALIPTAVRSWQRGDDGLTDIEREVLFVAGHSYSVGEVATSLSTSPKTVRNVFRRAAAKEFDVPQLLTERQAEVFRVYQATGSIAKTAEKLELARVTVRQILERIKQRMDNDIPEHP